MYADMHAAQAIAKKVHGTVERPVKLDKSLVEDVVNGVMSPDMTVLSKAIELYYHPDATFIHHLAKVPACSPQVQGRREIFKVFRVDHALFDIKIRLVDVGIDHEKQVALIWVDQSIKPRLPEFVQQVIPAVSCPVLSRLSFVRSGPSGQMLIKEQYDHISTYYLPSLFGFGSFGTWLHQGVFMPIAGWCGTLLSDIIDTMSGLTSAVISGPNVLTRNSQELTKAM